MYEDLERVPKHSHCHPFGRFAGGLSDHNG